jgi:hypothetical protein
MLDINSVIVVSAGLGGVAVFWWFVLILRPSVARQKFQIETQKVRDNLVDTYRRGDIHCDESQVEAFLAYCRRVSRGADRVSLVSVLVLWQGLKKLGVEPDLIELVHARTLRRNHSEPTLRQAQERVDALLWDYLINGSRLWWFLGPARALGRLALRWRRRRRRDSAELIMQGPSVIASELRVAAEGDHGSAAQSMTMLMLQDEPESTPMVGAL